MLVREVLLYGKVKWEEAGNRLPKKVKNLRSSEFKQVIKIGLRLDVICICM